MPVQNKRLGDRGEDLAVRFLRGNGYRILARNYRCPRGEIDLIARDGEIVVFVEIKGRSTRRFGSPLEAITPVKRRRLAVTAHRYLSACSLLLARTRFDVVGIRWMPDGGGECTLVRDAFRLE
jgi:putative endonuclease